jgi:hypothetical protein
MFENRPGYLLIFFGLHEKYINAVKTKNTIKYAANSDMLDH